MIEYIILTNNETEFRRIKRTLDNKKVDYSTRNKSFLVYQNDDEVKNVLKMWCRKYSSKVYVLKEWV